MSTTITIPVTWQMHGTVTVPYTLGEDNLETVIERALEQVDTDKGTYIDGSLQEDSAEGIIIQNRSNLETIAEHFPELRSQIELEHSLP